MGEDDFLRIRAGGQYPKLFEAADEKGKLRLERGARFAFVEGAEKRILFRVGDALGIEPFSKNRRKRALADAYRVFQCNVPGKIEKIGHGLGTGRIREYPECGLLAIEEEVNRERRTDKSNTEGTLFGTWHGVRFLNYAFFLLRGLVHLQSHHAWRRHRRSRCGQCGRFCRIPIHGADGAVARASVLRIARWQEPRPPG